MTLRKELLIEAVRLTAEDKATHRTTIQEELLLDRFVAEFVAESESLEGHVSRAGEVLNAVKELALR